MVHCVLFILQLYKYKGLMKLLRPKTKRKLSSKCAHHRISNLKISCIGSFIGGDVYSNVVQTKAAVSARCQLFICPETIYSPITKSTHPLPQYKKYNMSSSHPPPRCRYIIYEQTIVICQQWPNSNRLWLSVHKRACESTNATLFQLKSQKHNEHNANSTLVLRLG